VAKLCGPVWVKVSWRTTPRPSGPTVAIGDWRSVAGEGRYAVTGAAHAPPGVRRWIHSCSPEPPMVIATSSSPFGDAARETFPAYAPGTPR
jgi:hypothetical protein